MCQTGKLMHNLDQNNMKILNLIVLERMDPYIEEILITAAHVTFYEFNVDLNQWRFLFANRWLTLHSSRCISSFFLLDYELIIILLHVIHFFMLVYFSFKP
ncbi:putative mRNA-decapping enzyme subunit 1, PH-like domain superfamily [Helianthus anomalus]